MIHVALLRGINVGGNNRVPMARLRGLCQALGWRDVVTYISSGNVIFNAGGSDHLALAGALEDSIESAFGFRCRVLVKSGEDVLAVAAAIPGDWTNGAEMKADVVYLLDGIDPAAAIAELRPTEGIDDARPAPGAVLWKVARRDGGRSGLQRIIGTPLYQQATVRNINTARKLADLVSGGGGIRTHGRG